MSLQLFFVRIKLSTLQLIPAIPSNINAIDKTNHAIRKTKL